MTLIDFCSSSIQESSWLDTDVCIIGSGAAGLAIANEFLNTPTRVLLVESGGEDLDPQTQELYRSEIIGLPHAGTYEGRFRIIGGSTTKWGGQSLPLTQLDFQKREWIPLSGWDIDRRDLEDYYERGAKFLFTDTLNFDSDLLTALNHKSVEFLPHLLKYHFSKWSPHPNLREKYLPLIKQSSNITLIFHANVVNFELSNSLNQLGSITIKSLSHKTANIRAKYFILCCGGIETARLLLVGNQQSCPQGIGNQYNLVGHYFQDHPAASVGLVSPKNEHQFQALFNTCFWQDRKYSIRISASEIFQNQNQILNASGGIMFDEPEDSVYALAKDSFFQLKSRKLDRNLSKKIFQVSKNYQDLINIAYMFLIQKQRFVPRAVARLVLMCEQEPTFNSRIFLSSERDALGLQRAAVNWELTDLPSKTLYIFAQTISQEFARLGLGDLHLHNWLTEDYSSWRHHIGDQNHHIGTTRMHKSESLGVVDTSCRLHQVKNLYIGSSSVFPTSGHSNPTLTAIALSIRIADTLKHLL